MCEMSFFYVLLTPKRRNIMADANIERIKTTLSELQELVEIVAKDYPEAPQVLCKILAEKGEELCARLKSLNEVHNAAAEAPVAPIIPDEGEARSAEAEDEAAPHTEKLVEQPETASECAAKADEPVQETPEIRDEESAEPKFAFSWQMADESFCLFDRKPDSVSSPTDAPVSDEGEKSEAGIADTTPDTMPDTCGEVEAERSSEEAPDAIDDMPVVIPVPETSPSEETPVPEILPAAEPVSGKELQKMMSINDRFLFLRELFDGDEALMASTIDELNHIASCEESWAYLQNRFDWDFESETVELLRMLLQQRFE